MKKRLSYFPYNERSRSSWTLSTPRHLALSPIRSSIKTVTYVSGTFVTLVSGPYKRGDWGDFPMLPYNRRLKTKARSLRTKPTDAELHLWHRLRRKQILGVQFYRQKPIANYIADFYAPAAKLVVELDGAQHLEPGQSKYDAQRSRDLEQQGLKVLRFDDRQVLLQTEAVLETIFQAMKNPS